MSPCDLYMMYSHWAVIHINGFRATKMCQVHMSLYPPGTLGRLWRTRGDILMSGVIGEINGRRWTNSKQQAACWPSLRSCGYFSQPLWRGVGLMVWINGHSHPLCVVSATNNLSLYIDVLPRQTKAPLPNKPCSSAVTVFSKALKSEHNIVWL